MVEKNLYFIFGAIWIKQNITYTFFIKYNEMKLKLDYSFTGYCMVNSIRLFLGSFFEKKNIQILDVSL